MVNYCCDLCRSLCCVWSGESQEPLSVPWNANKSVTVIISVFIKLEAKKATCAVLTKQIENIMYIFYCGTEKPADTK